MYYTVYTATQTYHAPKADDILDFMDGAWNLFLRDSTVGHREHAICSKGVQLAHSVERVHTPSFQHEKTRNQNQKKAELLQYKGLIYNNCKKSFCPERKKKYFACELVRRRTGTD